MREEEINMQEVTSKEIAEALGMPPRTVVYWIHNKDLPAWKPFESDRAGWHTTVGDVRAFLERHAKDGGRSLVLFEQFVSKKFRQLGGGDSSPSALSA